MFKAKNIKTHKIEPILDTYVDDTCGTTFFLVWRGKWVWDFATNFVPPNWEEKNLEDKLS